MEKIDHLFVIGVAANRKLVSYFENSDASKELRKRVLLINGAVSTTSGIVEFHTGAGWEDSPDTGSLFKWSDSKREAI